MNVLLCRTAASHFNGRWLLTLTEITNQAIWKIGLGTRNGDKMKLQINGRWKVCSDQRRARNIRNATVVNALTLRRDAEVGGN